MTSKMVLKVARLQFHIPGKMNTKTNVLLRKDQVDTVKDNKDIQLLKKEM